MKRAVAIWLAASAAALLLVPATAAADSLAFPFPLPAKASAQLRALMRDQAPAVAARGSFHPRLELKARDGLRVFVIGEGSAVALVVLHRHAATAYVARGTVTPGRLEASFGKLGRVAVRFRLSANRTWVKPHRSCKGRGRFAVRSGVYVGTIRFRGEDGYLAVDAHRARGTVSSVAAQCERRSTRRLRRQSPPPKNPFEELELNVFDASWREAVSSTSVTALQIGGTVFFFASTGQSEGRLAKLRFAYAIARASAFEFNDALTRARISPPAPFVGTGAYRAAPDGTKTWSGSLSVNFPDAPRLPLTGPLFKPKLSVDSFG